MNPDQLAHQNSTELAEVAFGMTQLDWDRYQEDMRELHHEGYFGDDSDMDDDSHLDDEHDPFLTDGEADADALASAGMGMDEDYGYPDIDSAYEDRFDMGDDF